MKERRREKEEERKWNGTYVPAGELKVRTGSRIWGNTLTGREISWDRGGVLGACRRTQQLVCGRQDRVRPTMMVCVTALCDPA